MHSVRVIFLGSPDFAVPSLTELIDHPQIDVACVVTQPDRRAGRGRHVQPPAVKVASESAGIPVLQPETLRDRDAIGRLQSERPDVLVVVSYGEILRKSILDLAPHGCLNVHPSLLPRYRGATPIPACILNGDQETGVSIIRLVQKLDAGPLLIQESMPLTGTETTGELLQTLAHVASSILSDVVIDWVSEKITEQPQDDREASYTRELRKSDAQIDWSQPAAYIERFVRAMSPWPGAWTTLNGHRIAVHGVSIAPEGLDAPPGAIDTHDEVASVATGQGAVFLEEVQPAGKRAMTAGDWARGARLGHQSRFELPEGPIPPLIETR